MPGAPGLRRRQHGRQHGGQHMQHAVVVDVLVAQHHGQIEIGGAHVAVVACAVAHQVGRAAGQHLGRGGLHLFGLCRVHRHGHAAGVLGDKGIERITVAR
jgi:hypothetical protein